jgi:hypothetical protein
MNLNITNIAPEQRKKISRCGLKLLGNHSIAAAGDTTRATFVSKVVCQ